MSHYDIVGLGNAIVDILAHEEDSLINQLGLNKGAMTLVDLDQANSIYEKMGQTMMQSGGSAANTIVGIASFGGKCAFIGKVNDDEFGRSFAHDMQALSVDFHDKTASDIAPTAHCHILVTPDGERTMCTYLGISTEFSEDDIDPEKIENAKLLYLEGYLFDKPKAKAAFQKAASIAKANKTKVALTLSDPFCVTRHRDEFRALVKDHVDLVFCNEQELLELYETQDFSEALNVLKHDCLHAAVTRGDKGAIVIKDNERFDIKAIPVNHVVDTTGAGDLFAAGFLYAFANDQSPAECGQLGVAAAAEVITHMGPRPEIDLKTLLAA